MGTGRGITPKAKRMLVGALVALSVGNAAALAVHEAPSTTDPAATMEAAASPLPSVTVPTVPPSSPATTAARPTTPRPAAKGTASTAARPTTTTTAVSAAAERWPLLREGYDYELTLTPTCGKPGQLFTATMRLKAMWGAGGVFMPFYADGSHERGTGEIAKPDGTITYTWVAKPSYGEGRLVTQGYDPEAKQNGTKVVAFRVVKALESC